MKIVITGTTSGLGLACKNHFACYEIIELNRPQYDLHKNLEDFVLDNFDVYINNAYADYKQVELLYKLFDKNKDRRCKIINIGSVCADITYDRIYHYAIHKKALADACLQLQQINCACKIVHVRLGRMDTPMTTHRPNPKLKPAMIAGYLQKIIIDMPNEICIKDITIDNYFTNSL